MVGEEFDAAVIGAGLSGLIAARRLSQEGLRVAIFERQADVGGRLATHNVGHGWADSGAQFFTVRTPEFGRVVEQWLEAGLVFEWSRGWSDGSLSDTVPDGYPRYAARDGFANLAAYLARNLTVYPSFHVESLSIQGGRWVINNSVNSPATQARTCLLTVPAPLALPMLTKGGIVLPDDEQQALDSIRYGPCLCGLFAVTGRWELPAPGAYQRPGAAISWVADNHRKGVSGDSRTLTVHAGPAASQAYWQLGDEEILGWMWDEIRQWARGDWRMLAGSLVRWLHAVPLSTHPDRYLLSASDPLLLFAGDAFNGPRVEGAALSGLAAAQALLSRIS